MSGKRPAVEGLPAVRPVCQMCAKALRYWTNDTRSTWTPETPSVVVRRVFTRWIGYPQHAPLFCTLRCTLSFAIAAHRAGYRIERSA